MSEMFFPMYVNPGFIKLLSFMNSSFSSLSLCDSESLLQIISQILKNIINICCTSASEIFLQTFMQPCSICCSAERNSKLWSPLLIYRGRIQKLFESVQQDCVNIRSCQLYLLTRGELYVLSTAVKREASFYKKGVLCPMFNPNFNIQQSCLHGFHLPSISIMSCQ